MPLSAVVGALLSLLWIYVLESPEDPAYPLAVLVTFLAAIVEVSAEPMFIVGCASGDVKFKVFAEGNTIKCHRLLFDELLGNNSEKSENKSLS